MGSKGKERAIDAPGPSVLLGPLAALDIGPPNLASRLRALKIGANVIEPTVVSYSGTALGLNPSTADDDLKDRARRMKRIQERTKADYPEVLIDLETVDDFIEKLQAAEAAKALAKHYRDVMYANGSMFSTEYLYGCEPLWSAAVKHPVHSGELGYEEHEWRWGSLTWALRQDKSNMKIRDALDEDFARAGKLLNDKNVDAAIQQIFQHPEYTKFLEGGAGGLIVHAYDAEYREKSKNQSRGLRKLYGGRLTTSVISGFTHRFLLDFHESRKANDAGHSMMHAAGMCNTFKPQVHNLTGWRGLFRSLCNQLIAQMPYQKQLRLNRLTQEQLDEIKKERSTLGPFFELFHDLILDVAEYGVRKGGDPQEIIIVVDGIDWFEEREDKASLPTFDTPTLVQVYKDIVKEHGKSSLIVAAHMSNMTPHERRVVDDWLYAESRGETPTAKIPQVEKAAPPPKSDVTWEKIVEFFRNLADECNCTDLGTEVVFKYILLHPLSSKIGANPSVLERYITLDKDL